MKFIIAISLVAAVTSCSHKTAPVAQAAASATVTTPTDVPASASAKTESTEVVAGKAIYVTKCTRCHGLKKVDDYTVQDWVPILDRMAIKARLDTTEKAEVASYVDLYAKQGN